MKKIEFWILIAFLLVLCYNVDSSFGSGAGKEIEEKSAIQRVTESYRTGKRGVPGSERPADMIPAARKADFGTGSIIAVDAAQASGKAAAAETADKASCSDSITV